jgi:hypothetical protein
LVADVYKMGSLLDAFGIYSNYIYSDAEVVEIGGQGFIDAYQMIFYKGDYFVRLSAYNEPEKNRKDFMNCAQAIVKNISGESKVPPELNFLKVKGIIPLSEQYIAESLLGYKFLSKGIIAEVTSENDIVKIFVVIEESKDKAGECLNKYIEYLKENSANPVLSETEDGSILKAQDPIHKGLIAQKCENYIFGVVKLKEPDDGINLLMEMKKLLK